MTKRTEDTSGQDTTGQLDLNGMPSAIPAGEGVSPAKARKARKPYGTRGKYKKALPEKDADKHESRKAMYEIQISNCNELFDAQIRNPPANDSSPADDSPPADDLVDLNAPPVDKAKKSWSIFDDDHPDHLKQRVVEKFYDYVEPEPGPDGKKVVHKKAIKLHFKVPVLMGTTAETVLLACIQTAQVKAGSAEAYALQIKSAEGDAKDKKRVGFISSRAGLLSVARMPDAKKSYQALDLALDQLSDVKVHYENQVTRWAGSDMFIHYDTHLDTGELRIVLNWRLTGGLMDEYGYAGIDLEERAALKAENAKKLHKWLSGYVRLSRRSKAETVERIISYDTLVRHVYSTPTTEGGHRMRVTRIKEYLETMNEKLPLWDIVLLKDDAKIIRTKKPKHGNAMKPDDATSVGEEAETGDDLPEEDMYAYDNVNGEIVVRDNHLVRFDDKHLGR